MRHWGWWALVIGSAHCGGRSELTLVAPADACRADGCNIQGGGGKRGADGDAQREPDANVDVRYDGGNGFDAPYCPRPIGVTATQGTLDDAVVVSWTPIAPEVESLEVIRDGVVVAIVSSAERSFVDPATKPGVDGGAGMATIAPPSHLEATQGTRSDGILLTWTPAQSNSGPVHIYAVVSRCRGNTSARSSDASGFLGAPSLQYEISRDDGATWLSIPPDPRYVDAAAPLASLTPGVPTATTYFELTAVALRTTGAVAGRAPSLTYRVRASTRFGRVGETDSATGYRGVGTSMYQWQRSASSIDGGYSDLAGVTGPSWFDSSAPAGEKRFYRVVVSAEGAAPAISNSVSTIGPVRAIAIDAGAEHTCAIGADSKVRCWGKNDSGQAPPGPSVESFKAISAGRSQTCGIRTDDRVVCWGAAPTPPTDTFKAISAGGYHACGIRTTDDRVVCWGDNAAGEAPTAPSADTFKAVSAGEQFTCGIRTDDTLLCWGFLIDRPAPAGIFKTISAGTLHTCATRSDDKVLCWGTDQYGDAPPGPSADTFKVVAGGHNHTCGIRSDDKVVCWGNIAAPTTPSVDSFKAVTSGDHHTCGIRMDDTIACWGRNDFQEAPQRPSTDLFTAVAGGGHVCGIRADGKLLCWGGVDAAPPGPSVDAFRGVTVGTTQTCAIRTADDKVVCWGDNTYGQAPAGPTTTSFRKIAAGTYHTCGIRTDDRVVCWGMNQRGQAPTAPTNDAFRDLSAGFQHTCAIRSDDKVVCWGDNSAGQAPTTPSSDSFRAIAAGQDDTCGIRFDDKITCWGRSSSSLTPNAPTDSFRALAVGVGHVCGLRFDDHVFCWGDNRFGQLAAAPSIGTYLSIDADLFATCGVRSDGKIVCWGDDSVGQTHSLLSVP